MPIGLGTPANPIRRGDADCPWTAIAFRPMDGHFRRTYRRLTRLSVGARQELLRVLASPSAVRAELIRQMHERPNTRDLAQVLMDLEADPEMRLRVMEVLKDSPSSHGRG
jgi:hypothetical protein